MMSFSVVGSAAGAASYYSDKDNYYVLGSLESRWVGEGAKALGLEGKVENEKLTEVLMGKLPDGSSLSRVQDGKETHRAGYDLTFSAPKSVSVLALVGGDKRLIEAHNRAVEVAIKQVESIASARLTVEGKTETVLTGNIVAALFNHDTSRDLDPQLHTHAVIANATQREGEWKALSSDKVGKTGFSETILANQVALGKIYRNELQRDVESMGFKTEIVGKHGMWELSGVPVEPYSQRSQAINTAAGENASLKSRDIATLDTRKAKVASDPAELLVDWRGRLKEAGFDMGSYLAAAQQRTIVEPLPPSLQQDSGKLVTSAVGAAISMLSDKKVQFTYSELLAKTVSQLPAEPGVFQHARAGIETAIEQQRVVPLDREKGVFTSDIHLVDELSIHAMAKDIKQENTVLTFPVQPVVRDKPYSDVMSVLAQDKPAVAVLSGIGGASIQRERLAETITMAREQGREVHVLSPDKRSQDYLSQDERFQGSILIGRQTLTTGLQLPPNSTLVVDQAEKLSLKETISILEQGRNGNLQVLFMDTEQRKGIGNSLSVLQNADVPRYQYSGRERTAVAVISEADKNQRYERLAKDFVVSHQRHEHAVVQVSGVKEQQSLTSAIRGELKSAGVLGQRDHSINVITPVWLDSKTRSSRDSYRTGMVMERYDSESRNRERYLVDRVTDRSNSLTLINIDTGEQRLERIGKLDSSWTLYQAKTLAVAEGDTLRVLAKDKDAGIKAGDRAIVVGVSDEALQLKIGNKMVNLDARRALKVAHGYVEGIGASVSDKATVFAAAAAKDMSAAALNSLARSGREIHLYTALETNKADKKLANNPNYLLVTEQVKSRAGNGELDTAMQLQRDNLYTPAQQSVSLGLRQTEANTLAFTRTNLLAASLGWDSSVKLDDVSKEVDRQIKDGELINVPTAVGVGTDLLVSRASYDLEKSILRTIADGKDQVQPLMSLVPAHNLAGLTEGQRNSSNLILQSRDRFTAIQGYAGVGKTTQFKAVMSTINLLHDSAKPNVIGLGPTHRAVGEMQSAGVPAQTAASFLSETSQRILAGEKVDFSKTLFVIDEGSMFGNRDMEKAYRLIAEGGGRAVTSGDVDQLAAIDSGQPFKLMQQRSAIDIAVMKDIVRQSPELKPAIYSIIEGDFRGALDQIDAVKPGQVPRESGAWVPESSVVELMIPDESEKVTDSIPVLNEGRPGASLNEGPVDVIQAIVHDFIGRTAEAREQTITIAHLNEDRQVINSLIHDELHKKGDIGEREVALPILSPIRIPAGALRSAGAFTPFVRKTAYLEREYYTIDGVDKANGTVTLTDSDGGKRLLSSFESSQEEVSIFNRSEIVVSVGDKVRLTLSDNERGYVANSSWKVSAVDEGTVTISNGRQEKTLHPGRELAERHIDLAYAVTNFGAQGASERFSISLEGTEGARSVMVSKESAYVSLSRSKEHVQVYTDDREGWLDAISKQSPKVTAHDVLHREDDKASVIATRLLSTATPLQDTALGRALLNTSGLDGKSMARFIRPGKKYPEPHVALPVFDSNGRRAGVYLDTLRHQETGRGAWLANEPRLIGSEDARFAALQASQNGETRIAESMSKGLEVAFQNPESGVIIRLAGEGEPHNVQRITGKIIVNDNAVKRAGDVNKVDGSGEYQLPPTPEEKRQQEIEEQTRKATELQEKVLTGAQKEDEVVRDVAKEAPSAGRETKLPDTAVKDVGRDLDRDRAIARVAEDVKAFERFQQVEREILKDKTFGE